MRAVLTAGESFHDSGASCWDMCDKTIATCSARFGNALNFQGEPFLPGNDMLAQYPVPR